MILLSKSKLTTVECNQFLINTDTIQDFTIEYVGLTTQQANASSLIVEDVTPLGFPPPGGLYDSAVILLNPLSLPDKSIRTVDICTIPDKITRFESFNNNLYGQTFDLSMYPSLYHLWIEESDITNNIETITLPSTVWSRTDTNVESGIYFTLEGLQNLDTIITPSGWTGDYMRCEMWNLPNLTHLEFNGTWNAIVLRNFVNATTIDFTNCVLKQYDGVMPFQFSIYVDESTVSTINLPTNINFSVSDESGLFFYRLPNITYVDLSPLSPNIVGVDEYYSIEFWNCAIPTASVNQMLVEFDAITVTNTKGSYIEIDGTGTGAPDSSTGGYDGLAAKASLESKGITVYVN